MDMLYAEHDTNLPGANLSLWEKHDRGNASTNQKSGIATTAKLGHLAIVYRQMMANSSEMDIRVMKGRQ